MITNNISGASESLRREIKAQLARRALDQDSLAHLVGMSRSGLSNRLTGKCPFRVEELFAVAQALQVPASELLRRAELSAIPADDREVA